MIIIWHWLSQPRARHRELDTHFHHTTARTARRQRELICKLEGLTSKKSPCTQDPKPQPANH